MLRIFTFLFAVLITSPSWAGGIAVVDYQKALTETNEGKKAIAELEKSNQTKTTELENMRNEIQQEMQELQLSAGILDSTVAAQRQQRINEKAANLERTYMMYQGEMQQQQAAVLQKLDRKMRTVAQTMAQEQGFDILIDKSVSFYQGPTVKDITSALISRYNESAR